MQRGTEDDAEDSAFLSQDSKWRGKCKGAWTSTNLCGTRGKKSRSSLYNALEQTSQELGNPFLQAKRAHQEVSHT